MQTHRLEQIWTEKISETSRPFVTIIRHLIYSIIFLICVVISAKAQVPTSPPVKDDLQKTQKIKYGETVTVESKLGVSNRLELTMDAGTSVECNLGDREIAVFMTVMIPNDDSVSTDAGRIHAAFDGLVEPLVIVADKSGKYVTRTESPSVGKFSIGCGSPHPTTDRDRKYAAAQRLFLEIRQAIDAGKPLISVADKVIARSELYRELEDKKSLAMSMMDIGFVHEDRGDFDQAIAVFRMALEIFSALNSLPNIDQALQSMSETSEASGRYQEAIDYSTQRLAKARSRGATDLEADAVFALGILYHRLADERKAREFYAQYHDYQRSVDPPSFDSLNSQVLYFTNMANLVRGMDGGEIPVFGFAPRTTQDFRQAIVYLNRSFEVNQRIETSFGQMASLHSFNLLQAANCHEELGEYAEAIIFLDKFAAIPSSKTPRQRARVMVQYGSVHARMGDLVKATESFDEVIKLLRSGANSGNYHGYMRNIGEDYYLAGVLDRALKAHGEALQVARREARPMAIAESLYDIGRIERDLGNFNNARKNIEEAMQIAESVRARITADDLRTTYFSTVKRFYEFYIDLLMQAHKAQPEKAFDRLAFETSEKARSRNLLDLLTLSGVDIKQGVDPALLEREKTLRHQLSEKATQQTRLLMAKHTDAEAAKIKQVVADLSSQYDGVQSEIRAKSPNYAALTQPAALSSLQIQMLLDSGTVLLEYSLGEKKSYLWAVGVDSIESFDLPKKADLEARARRVYELATTRNRQIKGESVESRSIRVKKADAEYAIASASLSEVLLGPAANLIRNKRLLIVPDGALNYISFAALPGPGRQESAGVASAVIGQDHEVVTLPSASVLGRLRNDSASRKTPSKLLAVFADPVFSKADSRAKVAGALPGKKAEPIGFALTRDFERALEGSGLGTESSGGLPRLPFSRREADSIFNASAKSLSLKHLDFAANKQAVFDGGLDQYRIIHFATHGLLDSQNPGLSGMVLSLVDKDGADVDGFLRLQDVYNLKLNADLVVLSACNTALGKEVRGEGLIGLTRGFMYAGTPRVVASLWKVDDAATAEFMSIFYRKMLVDNLRPAAALRAAQMEMMKQPRWRSPYYWAPFVLQGEWK